MMAVSGLWVQYVTCKYRALTRLLKTGVKNPSLEKVVKTGKSEFDQENLEWSFSLNMKKDLYGQFPYFSRCLVMHNKYSLFLIDCVDG